MRKPIIAGNWKMNKTPSEARELVSALVPLVQDAKCDVVVCTPAVDFAAVSEVIKGTISSWARRICTGRNPARTRAS